MYKTVYHVDSEAPVEMYEIDARVAVGNFPKEWSDKPWGKSAVKQPEAPVIDLKGPFEARVKGAGWWAIYDADGKQVGSSIREPEGISFNAMSEEDKAEYVKAETAES